MDGGLEPARATPRREPPDEGFPSALAYNRVRSDNWQSTRSSLSRADSDRGTDTDGRETTRFQLPDTRECRSASLLGQGAASRSGTRSEAASARVSLAGRRGGRRGAPEAAARTRVQLAGICWASRGASRSPMIHFLLSLHDIGKFARKFQAKVSRLYPHILGDDPSLLSASYDHGVGGLRLFDADPERFQLPGGGSARAWRPLVSAVTGHHGAPPEAGIRPRSRRPAERLRQGRHRGGARLCSARGAAVSMPQDFPALDGTRARRGVPCPLRPRRSGGLDRVEPGLVPLPGAESGSRFLLARRRASGPLWPSWKRPLYRRRSGGVSSTSNSSVPKWIRVRCRAGRGPWNCRPVRHSS